MVRCICRLPDRCRYSESCFLLAHDDVCEQYKVEHIVMKVCSLRNHGGRFEIKRVVRDKYHPL